MGNEEKKSRIIVALDFPSVQEALELVSSLEGYKPYLKIGMQLYYLAGPRLVYELKEKGFPIFLDLKLHDIPNTVMGAARSITSLEVDMFNVHCAGGSKMMEAALEGVDKGINQGQAAPLVIGVTHLTSTSHEMLQHEIGIKESMEDAILHYARLAQQSGLAGVVCSPLEVRMLKEKIDHAFITVTPGIRPVTTERNDQVRVTSPQEAARLGTDYMVIGRAITNAENPAEAYVNISNELA